MSLYDADLAVLEGREQPSSKLPEEAKAALKSLIQEFDQEGTDARQDILQEVKQGELLWSGDQAIYYDAEAKDFATIWDAFEEGLIKEEDLIDYDKNINVYRGFGESIIAASSVEIPRVKFFPEDPDKPEDIVKARAYSKISKYLDVVNAAKSLIQRIYYTLYKEHFAATYVYVDRDEKYGTRQEDVYGDVKKSREVKVCADCGSDIDDMPMQEPEEAGFDMPLDEDMPPMDAMSAECPNCGSQNVTSRPEEYVENEIVDVKKINKTKVCVEVYGPRNIKVPMYARSLEACPYLIFDEEQNAALLAKIYPEKRKEILELQGGTGDKYDRWVRESTRHYEALETKSLLTHRRVWLRPWSYCLVRNEKLHDQLMKEYPDGALVCMVQDEIVRCVNSDMDEHWTLTESPIAETLYNEPLGKSLVPIQQILNDMLLLWVENIKHSVPEMFVDTETLNFKAYGQLQGRPGMRIPAQSRDGQTLANSFYETRSGQLPREFFEFVNWLHEQGQFVVGAFPSIYGGSMQGGSKTYAEYDASRQMALQRLGINFETVNTLWAKTKMKACELFEQALEEDTIKFGVEVGKTYKAEVIKRDEMEGKVARICPESSSAFPISWFQKRGVFLEILQSNNPQLIQMVLLPENATMLKELLGLDEMFVPGEQARIMQLEENVELLKTPPQLNPDGTPAASSIYPQEWEDHVAHAATVLQFLTSEEGREAKRSNPEGFQNAVLHFMEHNRFLMQGQATPPPPGAPPAEAPPPPTTDVEPPPAEGV